MLRQRHAQWHDQAATQEKWLLLRLNLLQMLLNQLNLCFVACKLGDHLLNAYDIALGENVGGRGQAERHHILTAQTIAMEAPANTYKIFMGISSVVATTYYFQQSLRCSGCHSQCAGVHGLTTNRANCGRYQSASKCGNRSWSAHSTASAC